MCLIYIFIISQVHNVLVLLYSQCYSYTSSFTFSSCSQVILPLFSQFLKKYLLPSPCSNVGLPIILSLFPGYFTCYQYQSGLGYYAVYQVRVIDSVSYFPCFSSLCYRLYLSRKQGVLFEITEVQRDEAPRGRVSRTLQNH